jgi:hypothetical protein
MAPVFASTGRVVTRSPLEEFSVISDLFSVRKKPVMAGFPSLLFQLFTRLGLYALASLVHCIITSLFLFIFISIIG